MNEKADNPHFIKKLDTCITNLPTRCGTVNSVFHMVAKTMCKLTDYTYLAEYTWKTLLCLIYNITVMSHATLSHKHEKKVQMACDVHAAT